MSVERAPGHPGPAPATRPTLSVISTCTHCQQSVTEVRDRNGKPVRLLCGDDGLAIRDPNGEWWAAKSAGRWCVVQVQPGEDPPTSGKGVRYSEHRCLTATAEAAIRSGFVDTADVPADAVRPVTLYDHQPGVVRRPAGRGDGLRGAQCPERDRLIQVAPAGGPPFQRMCIRCGRVTARSDGDTMPWCGGGLV